MRFYALIVFTALVLGGCAATPNKELVQVTEVRTHVVSTPDALLTPCTVTKPPNRQTYPLLTERQKENVLTNYILALQDDLKLCNAKLVEIRKFQDNETLRYKDKK
jgi:PBP1b-binding outer membrane lipoprotein LpoB